MAQPFLPLTSPAFARNARPILEVLQRVLKDRHGDVLEIGSGPGQHVAAFAAAMPALDWWPSDPDPRHLASIEAWREEAGCANLKPAVCLDASAQAWPVGRPGEPSESDLAAILCINVVHIAPWHVAKGVLRAASRLLSKEGLLVLYGPYSRGGRHTAPSNAAFDAALRAQNPDSGVRDLADMATLAGTHGLEIAETIDMPSNNFCLVLRRVRSPSRPADS